MINVVYAPSTVTTAETFLWYNATPDLKLGVAHLYEQNALRALASFRVSKETEARPAFYLSAGVQGIGTGNPGFSATAEKNFRMGEASLNGYVGLGYRSNESHFHALAGAKVGLENGFSLGFQYEGHGTHPFVTYSWDRWIVGFYLIEGKSPAYMLGARF